MLNTQGDVRLGDADSDHFVAFQAPAVVAVDYTLTMPVDAGLANQFLQTDGTGVLTWTSVVLAANNISNTAAGNIAATDVQAAINELDPEKVAKAGDTMTGNLVMNAQSEVRYADLDSSNYVALRSPAVVASDYTLTLPVDDGAANQVMMSRRTRHDRHIRRKRRPKNSCNAPGVCVLQSHSPTGQGFRGACNRSEKNLQSRDSVGGKTRLHAAERMQCGRF
jgi:hypothetical protein